MSAGLAGRIVQGVRQHRWLLSRRLVQLFVITAFIVEWPRIGRLATGNLSSSEWLGVLPLTDPFVWTQSLLAGASIATTSLLGAVLIAVFYALFGGRIYCSWVCPINLVTDLAHWLRQRLKIKGNMGLSREYRTMIRLLALVLCAVTGTLAWETINPITLFQRELMWASATGATLLIGLFLFDVLVTRRGWCGHLCPVGAFYGWLGRYGRLRVKSENKDACAGSACSACIKACPEPHVLAPVIAGQAQAVTHRDCTRCGACLDQCTKGALSMKLEVRSGKSFRSIAIVSKH